MQFIIGTAASLQPALMAAMARYRHKVFVERLGWQLQCENGLEYDQFDRDDTVYVVAQNYAGDVIGTARLLPTTRPYLLGEVFPQLLNGLPPPAAADIWELSRFAAVDFNASSIPVLGQFSSPITIGLLSASLRCAASYGAKMLVVISPPSVERLLQRLGFRLGFKVCRLAAPGIIDGKLVVSCSISCELWTSPFSSVDIRQEITCEESA